MEDLEIEVRKKILNQLKFRINVYYRFGDDIFTIVPTEFFQKIEN